MRVLCTGGALDAEDPPLRLDPYAEAGSFVLEDFEDRGGTAVSREDLALVLGFEVEAPGAEPGEEFLVGESEEGGLEEAARRFGLGTAAVTVEEIGDRT